MKRVQYLGLIILSLIVVYMGFGLKRFLAVNDGYKIIQVDNLENDDIYKYLYIKYPIVILNTLRQDDLLKGLSVEKIRELFGKNDGYYSIQKDGHICSKYAPRFDKIDKLGSLEGENPWKCLLNHTFIKTHNLYKPIGDTIKRCSPKLSLNNRYSITISSSGYIEPLQYSQSYKTLITSISGTKHIRIFNPNYKKMLYMDDKFHPNYRMSKINIWNEWDKLCKKYEKIKDTSYIDIILREGNTVMIPNFWFFSTRNEDQNITLYSKIDTVLTHVLQLPYEIEKTLHFMGLYKVNKCYCHKSIR